MRKIILAATAIMLVLTATVSFAGTENNLEIRKFKSDFNNSQEDFYDAAKAGFLKYFRRYSPEMVSKDDKKLVMAAKYGKHDILCIFYQDENSRYFVAIDTKFNRDRVKWIENVVKQVEARAN